MPFDRKKHRLTRSLIGFVQIWLRLIVGATREKKPLSRICEY